ncbi:MAG: sensor histidine kinase, partial [Schleiferiaceae bacterium]
VPILVVDEQPGYLTISVFNKGNIPEFGIDILHPFKRGTNSIEGTGFGLGLSLVNDLVSDYNCDFSLENVGQFTRCQLKLPLART